MRSYTAQKVFAFNPEAVKIEEIAVEEVADAAEGSPDEDSASDVHRP